MGLIRLLTCQGRLHGAGCVQQPNTWQLLEDFSLGGCRSYHQFSIYPMRFDKCFTWNLSLHPYFYLVPSVAFLLGVVSLALQGRFSFSSSPSLMSLVFPGSCECWLTGGRGACCSVIVPYHALCSAMSGMSGCLAVLTDLTFGSAGISPWVWVPFQVFDSSLFSFILLIFGYGAESQASYNSPDLVSAENVGYILPWKMELRIF